MKSIFCYSSEFIIYLTNVEEIDVVSHDSSLNRRRIYYRYSLGFVAIANNVTIPDSAKVEFWILIYSS